MSGSDGKKKNRMKGEVYSTRGYSSPEELRQAVSSGEHVEVDLHGLHPRDDEDEPHGTIERELREAWEAGAKAVTFIHGHGFSRASYRPQFAYTNTGYLGLTVRSYLRNGEGLRWYMLAKIDVSDIGATTARVRSRSKKRHRGV